MISIYSFQFFEGIAILACVPSVIVMILTAMDYRSRPGDPSTSAIITWIITMIVAILIVACHYAWCQLIFV